MNTPVTLFLCKTCGYKKAINPDGTPAANPLSVPLAEAIRQELTTHHPQAAPHIRVEVSGCLSVCTQGLAWGLRGGNERYAYTFGHAPTGEDAAQILAATAVTYLTTPPGEKLRKSALPEAIRGTTVSKLPPVS